MRVPRAFVVGSLQYTSRRDKARLTRTSRGFRDMVLDRRAWMPRDWFFNLLYALHVCPCDWNAAERMLADLPTYIDWALCSSFLMCERASWGVLNATVYMNTAMERLSPAVRTNDQCRRLLFHLAYRDDMSAVWQGPSRREWGAKAIVYWGSLGTDDPVDWTLNFFNQQVSTEFLSRRGVARCLDVQGRQKWQSPTLAAYVASPSKEMLQAGAAQGHVYCMFHLFDGHDADEYMAPLQAIGCVHVDVILVMRQHQRGELSNQLALNRLGGSTSGIAWYWAGTLHKANGDQDLAQVCFDNAWRKGVVRSERYCEVKEQDQS